MPGPADQRVLPASRDEQVFPVRDFERLVTCSADQGVASGPLVDDVVRAVARRDQLTAVVLDSDRIVRPGVEEDLGVVWHRVGAALLFDLDAGRSGVQVDDARVFYGVDYCAFRTWRKAVLKEALKISAV